MSDWTSERTDKLKVLWTQGFSCSQIAMQIGGVTRNAVIGKVTRLGLPARLSATKTKRLVRAAKPTQRISTAPKNPKHIPHVSRGTPKRGPNSVRFTDRKPNQCAFFCEGEEGALGFVCGEEVVVKAWCRNCASRVFQVNQMQEAA